MSTTQSIVLVLAVILVLGYLLTMRVLFRQSRELDKQVDFTKIRPWKDEEGRD